MKSARRAIVTGQANGDLDGAVQKEREQVLVSRCLQGDTSAWEVIVRSYRGRIGKMVWRYATLRNEVDDLTQEVFVRVYCNLQTFRSDTGSLSHWLNRVGRNLVFDRLRQRQRGSRCQAVEDLESLNLTDEKTAAPDHDIGRLEMSNLLRRGLRLLSPDLREAIVLRYIEEMSYQEIARRLGVPDGTAKSRVNRGRAKLAFHLSRLGVRRAA
jgi:RNA polymerase sigma-70 factor (ECF subfamily)